MVHWFFRTSAQNWRVDRLHALRKASATFSLSSNIVVPQYGSMPRQSGASSARRTSLGRPPVSPLDGHNSRRTPKTGLHVSETKPTTTVSLCQHDGTSVANANATREPREAHAKRYGDTTTTTIVFHASTARQESSSTSITTVHRWPFCIVD